MEKTNKAVDQLNIIFDTISIIYDSKELYFHGISRLSERLQFVLQTISLLDVTDVSKEIWDATSVPNREEKARNLMNSKFEKVFQWKPDCITVDQMNTATEKDIVLFLKKQSTIDRNYLSADRALLLRIYRRIGQYFMKMNHDLEKEMVKLVVLMKKEAKTEQTKKESNLLKSGSIKLNPDMQIEFATLLNKMIAEKFFIHIDDTVELNGNDIIKAFEELFRTELIFNTQDSKANPIIEPNPASNQNAKSFHDYILHSQRIKIAEAIRQDFFAEKGKNIRLMLYVLENHNPPLITISFGQAKIIYNAMKLYFNWEIGSYQSIFNQKTQLITEAIDIDKISTRINHILNSAL